MTTAASRASSDMGMEGGVRRKGTSGASGRGKMNALKPTFGMTSNAEASSPRSPPPPASHDRRPSRDGPGSSAKGHKSSDRLYRLGAAAGSTSHLASKRSKSQTHLAAQQAAPSQSKKDSNSAKGRRRQKGGKAGREENEEDEEGWTSASATGTPDQSLQASPKGSDEDSEEDEDGRVVLKMGSKKKAGPSVPAGPLKLQLPSHDPSPHTHNNESTTALSGAPRKMPEEPKTPTLPAHSALPHLTSASRTDSEATLGKSSCQEEVVRERSVEIRDTAPGYLAPLRREEQRPNPLQSSHPMPSSASNRTLTEGGGSFYAGGHGASSASITSRRSSRSRTTSLLPQTKAAAPPMLSTQNVHAGALGSLHEGQSAALLSQSPPSSSLFAFGEGVGRSNGSSYSSWIEGAEGAHRGSRVRKISASSHSSHLTLPNLGETSSSARAAGSGNAAGRQEIDAVTGSAATKISPADAMLAPGAWERRRVQSLQSNGNPHHNTLTAADAAKLAAKLRQARDAMDDVHGARGGPGGLGGSSRSGMAALANVTIDGKYTKPVISTFAKDSERKWSPHAVPLTARSEYASGYIKMQNTPGKAVTKDRVMPRFIRYVAKYGLGGPPIAQTTLNEALLAPSFDGDEFEASWAPALANAAGLGSRSSRPGGLSSSFSNFREEGIPLHDPGMAFTGSAAVNGPNATPVHLIHGLTTISPDPFPLDPVDVPSLAAEEQHGLTADSGTLRAIALTSQVLSTYRSHTMTRRFFDPMREALGRIATHKAGGAGGAGDAVGAGHTWPSSSSSAALAAAGGLHVLRRQNASGRDAGSSSSSLYPSLAEAPESPVQSLRRVWSSKGNVGTSTPGSASGSGRSAR